MRSKSWPDVPEERMNARMTRRALHTVHMTIARIGLEKGGVVPAHSHSNEQVTTVQSGRLLFRMGGEEIIVAAGEFLEIPPGLPHQVEALEDSVAVDVFSPRREDWIDGSDAYLRAPTEPKAS